MKKTVKTKLFIVAPTDIGVELGDTLHVVAKCKKSISAFDAYQTDQYEELHRSGSLTSAKRFCLKLGVKNPKVI